MTSLDDKLWDIVYSNFIKDNLKHTHGPTKGLVNGCKYCETFGNVFEKGCVSYKPLDLMYAFKKETDTFYNETITPCP